MAFGKKDNRGHNTQKGKQGFQPVQITPAVAPKAAERPNFNASFGYKRLVANLDYDPAVDYVKLNLALSTATTGSQKRQRAKMRKELVNTYGAIDFDK